MREAKRLPCGKSRNFTYSVLDSERRTRTIPGKVNPIDTPMPPIRIAERLLQGE